MNYKDWTDALRAEEKAHEDYRKEAQQVVDRYEDEEKRDDSKFNILWSNTEVLHSALYAKSPIPDIRRRFLDKDPNGKEAAEVAERAASYCIDTYDFDGTIDISLDDYLISGLGQVRLRYTPYFEEKETRIDLEMMQTGIDPVYYQPTYGMFNGEQQVDEYEEDEQGCYICGEPEEEKVYEEVSAESVNWNLFRWQPAKRWDDVDWSCIDHYMTIEELKDDDILKDRADDIPLGYGDNGEKDVEEDQASMALIHEIFDKKERKYIYIAEGLNEIIAEIDDPLELEGFYPFPKPLHATLKNGKFIPIPDYMFYEDQAIELDLVTQRITKLTEQLKYRGVYDGSFKELQNVANADDGEFMSVDDFQERFQGKGDLDKVIAAMPIDDIQQVLVGLHKSREEIKQVIYEITGIADIMRGASNAQETLGAQQLKTQFGSMRMGKRQRNVASFIRDIVRLKVEIMVENFSTETLEQMTGKEISPEVEQILKDDLMRSYRIDIETDSTIAEDAAQEKQSRIELVTAVTAFMEKVGPMVQAQMLPMNVATELLGFVFRGFKIGRSLEDVLDEMSNSDQDPKQAQMQQQMQRQVEQMKQQVGQHVQQMQEAHGKEKEALEGKLFEAQKKLAINVESSNVRIAESKIKGDIAIQTQQDKNEMSGQLEIFKAQLDAILKIPEEKSNQMDEMINMIGQAFIALQSENEQKFTDINGRIDETGQNISQISDYMKRPAKAVKQKDGSWTASRD